MNELTIFICAIRIIPAYINLINFLVAESVFGGGTWMNELTNFICAIRIIPAYINLINF